MSIKGGILDSIKGIKKEKSKEVWEKALEDLDRVAVKPKEEISESGGALKPKPEEAKEAEENWFLNELQDL